MKKTVFSLALATFGLGMAEFGIMGVLTELAKDVGISIPSAGYLISGYAVGVVIGAPIMALFSSRFSAQKGDAVSGGVVRPRKCHLYLFQLLYDVADWPVNLRVSARCDFWRRRDNPLQKLRRRAK